MRTSETGDGTGETKRLLWKKPQKDSRLRASTVNGRNDVLKTFHDAFGKLRSFLAVATGLIGKRLDLSVAGPIGKRLTRSTSTH